MLILAVLLIFLCIILAIFVFYTAMMVSIFFEAPFVPSSTKATKTMLEAAHIIPGEVVYDLGSGDGRLVRGAARLGAKAIGVERSRLLILCSRIIAFIAKAPTHTFIRASFYDVDLRNADIVFTYLFPNVMEKLKTKFEKELPHGARVVSYAFKVPGWTAKERIQFSPKSPAVYVYVKE